MSQEGRSHAHIAAIAAAEGIRQINHLTLFARVGPSEVYDVLGALGTMASRLPQSCQQLGRQLADAQARGALRSDRGRPVDVNVAEAVLELEEARHAAAQLQTAFNRAQSLISDLYLEGTGGD